MNEAPITIERIERETQAYSEAYSELRHQVEELQAEMEAVKRRRLANLRRALGKANTRRESLKALLEASPALFEKPKTRTFHNIKIGYRKNKGGLEIADAQKVCELIQKHFPDQEDILIRTTKAPDKVALGNLTAKDLKRLGVEIIDATDEVVISSVDSAVDKIVTALLKDQKDDLAEQAA